MKPKEVDWIWNRNKPQIMGKYQFTFQKDISDLVDYIADLNSEIDRLTNQLENLRSKAIMGLGLSKSFLDE